LKFFNALPDNDFFNRLLGHHDKAQIRLDIHGNGT